MRYCHRILYTSLLASSARPNPSGAPSVGTVQLACAICTCAYLYHDSLFYGLASAMGSSPSTITSDEILVYLSRTLSQRDLMVPFGCILTNQMPSRHPCMNFMVTKAWNLFGTVPVLVWNIVVFHTL